MRQTRRSAEVGRQEADLTASGPFLELARELQAEAQRWAADPDAGIESLVEVFDRLPREARQRAAEATFRSLPAEQRWAVLERLFGDDELRAALGHERDVAVLSARATTRRAALVEDVVARHVLDTRLIPAGEQVTLGLFRESDVRVALRSGPQSTNCARRLVLQATVDRASLHVVADVFNPFNGLFVTPDYDERTWRAERVEPHADVRIGATTDGRFEPLVYPGGRLDIELAGAVRPGRLHVGWACVGDHNLFQPTNNPASTGGTQP